MRLPFHDRDSLIAVAVIEIAQIRISRDRDIFIAVPFFLSFFKFISNTDFLAKRSNFKKSRMSFEHTDFLGWFFAYL